MCRAPRRAAPQEEEREERRRNAAERCKVVWEGQVIKANFKAFHVEPARTADVTRKLLKDRGCEHYWDMLHPPVCPTTP